MVTTPVEEIAIESASEAEPIVPASAIVIPALNIALPASLPSKVSIVISDVASVPLNIISLSFAVASTVILPEVVERVTAASPAVKSSAASPDTDWAPQDISVPSDFNT